MGINKSAAVRDILARNPSLAVSDIVRMLNQRGIQIHPNLVYLIKSKAKAKGQIPETPRPFEESREMESTSPVELILETRKLAEKAGGIGQLKQLVEVLAE
jgi:hypothetical protein